MAFSLCIFKHFHNRIENFSTESPNASFAFAPVCIYMNRIQHRVAKWKMKNRSDSGARVWQLQLAKLSVYFYQIKHFIHQSLYLQLKFPKLSTERNCFAARENEAATKSGNGGSREKSSVSVIYKYKRSLRETIEIVHTTNEMVNEHTHNKHTCTFILFDSWMKIGNQVQYTSDAIR